MKLFNVDFDPESDVHADRDGHSEAESESESDGHVAAKYSSLTPTSLEIKFLNVDVDVRI